MSLATEDLTGSEIDELACRMRSEFVTAKRIRSVPDCEIEKYYRHAARQAFRDAVLCHDTRHLMYVVEAAFVALHNPEPSVLSGDDAVSRTRAFVEAARCFGDAWYKDASKIRARLDQAEAYISGFGGDVVRYPGDGIIQYMALDRWGVDDVPEHYARNLAFNAVMDDMIYPEITAGIAKNYKAMNADVVIEEASIGLYEEA